MLLHAITVISLWQQGACFEADAVELGLAGGRGGVFDGGAASDVEGEGADAAPGIQISAAFQVVADSGTDVVEVDLEVAAHASSGGDARGGAEVLRGVCGTGASEVFKVVALAVEVGIAQRVGSEAS